ncbi:MAG: GNAT family N-acetyltransferase [Parvularculaceae bacterium]
MTFVIETKRLRLRPPEPEDCDAHIEMMLDPAVAATLFPGGKPTTRAEQWRSFATILGHWRMRRFGFFSVEIKETGEWIGRVGPWMPEGWPALECGWTIASKHWGKGYAPEAAIAATRWTFDRFPELERIISVIAPSNVKSQAVAAKIGETKTAEEFQFNGMELNIWAAERDEWLARF